MLFSKIFVFIFFLLKYNLSVPIAKEPMCSKFAYEEQLLEKMIRQEINVEAMQKDIKKSQESASNTLEDIKNTDIKVTQTLQTLHTNFTELAEKTTKDQEKTEDVMLKMFEEQRNSLTEEVEKQRNALQAFEKTFEELRTNLTKETEEHRKTVSGLLENLNKPSVAFYAHHVKDLKLDRTDKIIVFTNATTNEGSGYDTSTGIFTARVGGLYQFIVSFCSKRNEHAPLALVVSGNVIARLSHHDDSYYPCTSFPAVTRVESGDKIWVKCLYGSSSYELYRNSWFMNSFSGFLINK